MTVVDAAPHHATAAQRGADGVRCPRCGYQLGADLPMRAEPPVEGTCSECGLTFEWRELFSGRLTPPRWLFEHAPVRRAPVALLATIALVAVPWQLWRRVRMAHDIRGWRCAMLAAVPLVVAFAVLIYGVIDDVDQGILSAMGPSSAAQVRTKALLEVLMEPWSTRAVKLTTKPSSRGPAPVPIVLASPFAHWYTSARRPEMYMMRALPLAALGSVAAFAVLPIARRRAKVRWAHLARTGAYSLASTPLLFLACVYFGLAALPFGLLCCMFLAMFWYCTARDYLRMEQPFAIAASVSVIGTLVMLVALDFMVPGGMRSFG